MTIEIIPESASMPSASEVIGFDVLNSGYEAL
jgi:hypothetical protein